MLSGSETPQEAYVHVQVEEGSDSDDSRFYIARPTWRIGAIAHGLAQTARFAGQADEFYSVAEHSCLVAALMAEVTGGNPREGLLHDAHESVLTDVPSPFKQLMPEYRQLEARLESDLRAAFSLSPSKSEACQQADWLAVYIEAAQILPGRGLDFVDPYGLRPTAMRLRDQDAWRVRCLPWKDAKRMFLAAYEVAVNGPPPRRAKRTWGDVDLRMFDAGGGTPSVSEAMRIGRARG